MRRTQNCYLLPAQPHLGVHLGDVVEDERLLLPRVPLEAVDVVVLGPQQLVDERVRLHQTDLCGGNNTLKQGGAIREGPHKKQKILCTRYSLFKDHSDSEKGNPLPPYGLLLSINSKGSFICTIPQTG